jgi:tetraacyldisaccharide 4'-kinase
VVRLRNLLFDKGVLKSVQVDCKSIVVGNLSAGGTGKTPFVLWLLSRYSERGQLAVLSRGYGRETQGFMEVNASANAMQCGDEPLLIKQRFPQSPVYVCEDRIIGAEGILKLNPEINTLILDDAFQHRKFKPGLSILLTTWGNPFVDDWYLPSGNLRDWKGAYHRADIIVVTKCPKELEQDEAVKWREKLSLSPQQKLAFTSISYGSSRPLFGKGIEPRSKIILVSGIADPKPFEQHCKDKFEVLKHFKFQDHHAFKASDIARILNSIGSFGEPVGIVTTEKDATRLRAFQNELRNIPTAYIPIEIEFPLGDIDITGLIDQYIQNI